MLLFVFDGIFEYWKDQSFNLTIGTEGITLSQTLGGPGISEDTNVTLLPKRKLFFELVPLVFILEKSHGKTTDKIFQKIQKNPILRPF